jgi:hypothetical protein
MSFHSKAGGQQPTTFPRSATRTARARSNSRPAGFGRKSSRAAAAPQSAIRHRCRIPDYGRHSACYDPGMKRRTLLPIAILGLLAGCGPEPMHLLGCLQSGDELVIVSGNSPSALDGYNYEVCTARTGSPKCEEFNRATINRPASMTVSLTGGVARIDQTGGSIFNYSTDPSGMRDPNYTRAIPLEITFTFKADKIAARPSYQIEGKLVQLGQCPKS